MEINKLDRNSRINIVLEEISIFEKLLKGSPQPEALLQRIDEVLSGLQNKYSQIMQEIANLN